MIDRVLCVDTPPRGGRQMTVAAALLLTAGLTLWVVLPTTGLWVLGRIGAIGLITAGLYLALRWLARIYTYRLEQHENGQIDFVVIEQNGRRCTTVCRVGLDTVTRLPGDTPAKQRGALYRYFNAPRPAGICVLCSADPDGMRYLHITPGAEMHRLLTMLCPVGNGEDFSEKFTQSP